MSTSRTTRLLIAIAACLLGPATARAQCTSYAGWWDFEKITNTNSRIKWVYTDFVGIYVIGPLRAGSGTTTDPCERNKGWIPSARYDIREHTDHRSSGAIFGRTWWLSDYSFFGACPRDGLFLHTEETPSQGQSSTQESQRWDGDNDYKSEGCVKVSHEHMALWDHVWHNRGGIMGYTTLNAY